jgi:hypothetical protein|tara:strand:+ start:264 stop:1325 length:1062 start_codon:yes stop_codon:yes gene_type:complete
MVCSACGQEGHRKDNKKCPKYDHSKSNKKAINCGACGQEGHRSNNKICPLYDSNKTAAKTKTSDHSKSNKKAITCGACGREGHRKTNKICPLYDSNKTAAKTKTKWKDSFARAELRSIFMSDDDSWVYLAMPAEELQELRESFKVYQKSKFKGYVISLKNEVMKVNPNWPHPWEKSPAKDHAKSLLMEDSDGTYQSKDSKTFWNLSPLFQAYPLENFEKYLSTMKSAIRENKRFINGDEAALRHDRLILPPKKTTKDGKPRWDRHDAKKLLKIDIMGKKHETMKPEQLLNSREEFQAFANGFADVREGKSVFRKHIFQEVYGQEQSAYWQNKAEKKLEEKKKLQSILKPFMSS